MPEPDVLAIHPTVEARRRLERAKQHIDAYEVECNRYMAESPFEIIQAVDSDRGRLTIRVRIIHEPPTMLGFLLGDAVHNMRSTLDNLFWGFARLHQDPPVSPAQVQFPLFLRESESDFKKKDLCWNGRGAKRVTAVAPSVRKVVKDLQPFSTKPTSPDEDLLWILNELWNADKHRRTVIVGSAVGNPSSMRVGSMSASGGLVGPYFIGGPFQDGDVIAGIDFNPRGGFQISDTEFNWTTRLVFSPTGPAGGNSAFGLMKQIHQYLENTVIPAFDGL